MDQADWHRDYGAVTVRAGYRLVAVYQEKQHIEQQLQELKQRNEELEQEKAKLQDPKTIEGVAREELGLVKPGEVPYVK